MCASRERWDLCLVVIRTGTAALLLRIVPQPYSHQVSTDCIVFDFDDQRTAWITHLTYQGIDHLPLLDISLRIGATRLSITGLPSPHARSTHKARRKAPTQHNTHTFSFAIHRFIQNKSKSGFRSAFFSTSTEQECSNSNSNGNKTNGKGRLSKKGYQD